MDFGCGFHLNDWGGKYSDLLIFTGRFVDGLLDWFVGTETRHGLRLGCFSSGSLEMLWIVQQDQARKAVGWGCWLTSRWAVVYLTIVCFQCVPIFSFSLEFQMPFKLTTGPTLTLSFAAFCGSRAKDLPLLVSWFVGARVLDFWTFVSVLNAKLTPPKCPIRQSLQQFPCRKTRCLFFLWSPGMPLRDHGLCLVRPTFHLFATLRAMCVVNVFFFPTCQVRVVRFYVCCPSFLLLPSSSSSSSFLLPSSSSSSSQTSSLSCSPDVARCQHGPPECSGQRRTSTAS